MSQSQLINGIAGCAAVSYITQSGTEYLLVIGGIKGINSGSLTWSNTVTVYSYDATNTTFSSVTTFSMLTKFAYPGAYSIHDKNGVQHVIVI